MKVSIASIIQILGVTSLLSNPVSANTPDLCTTDITDLRQIKPSEADPTGRVGPNITVGSTEYSNDEPHFVIGKPNRTEPIIEGSNDHILVYLPGTTDWPALSSCLLKSAAAYGVPTIGLTYGFLSRGDGFRNTRCASLNTTALQVECLTEHHNDAIYGGTYGAERVYNEAEFWKPVDPKDSIAGRLGYLLAKLDKDYPEEGWDKYYSVNGTSIPTPEWSMLAFMGHSQGAGHAAYLAQTKKTSGAVLISGPQDECTGCPAGTKFWIDDDFMTSKVTAFAHGDAGDSSLEPTLPIMEDNWKRMAASGTVEWPSPLTVVDTGSEVVYDVCNTPIVSKIEPSATSPCGRKGHCSTALDDSAPVIKDTEGKNVYVFGLGLWAAVSDVGSCAGIVLEDDDDTSGAISSFVGITAMVSATAATFLITAL